MKAESARTGDVTLRIRIEDGRIVGETIHTKAPPDHRVTRWQYLKITPGGSTWVFMNGMRPRGVILFEAKLEGDVLSGRSRFGGIDFRTPGGSATSLLSFSLRRVPK